MPLYKSGIDMYKKYESKFNPTVIGTRFTDVKPLALERAQAGLNAVATVRDLIRPILDKYGVGGGQRATYLAFGTALWSHVIRAKDQTGKVIADGLKSYFATAYGLNPDILNEIIQVVSGWVLPY
ncbi:MAG: hypothetical protein ACPLYF_03015 [Fervidobacterium sp.]